jgi:hypothetical protein
MGDQLATDATTLHIRMDIQLVELEFTLVDLAEGETDAATVVEGLVEPFVQIFQVVVQALVTVALFEHEVDLLLGDDARIGCLPDFTGQRCNGRDIGRRDRANVHLQVVVHL